jgi:hypothetical protein
MLKVLLFFGGEEVMEGEAVGLGVWLWVLMVVVLALLPTF